VSSEHLLVEFEGVLPPTIGCRWTRTWQTRSGTSRAIIPLKPTDGLNGAPSIGWVSVRCTWSGLGPVMLYQCQGLLAGLNRPFQLRIFGHG
jgi:hypothetical protein